MDDKTLIAKYTAEETTRINERLKKMLSAEEPPSKEESDAVMADIEQTLARLKSALSFITPEMLDELEEEDKKPA